MRVKDKLYVKGLIQQVFNRLGYHVKRLNKGVDLSDAHSEIRRLLSQTANTIFDVGANVGRTAKLYHDTFPQAKIYAFEPMDIHYFKLKKVSSSRKNILPYKVGVSNINGQKIFYETALSDSSSLFKPLHTGAQFDEFHELKKENKINLITIDTFANENNINKIDLLKIDIQGGELDALRGATSLLNGKKIKVIYTEIQFFQLYEKAPLFHNIVMFLENFGYELHNIYDLNYNQNGKLAWGDAIFIPKADY